MKYPSVSVIVLNYNGGTFIKKCLDSLLKQNYPNFEVVVADNASTDDSANLVEKKFPKVRMIRFDKNWGFAEGYNKAISKVKSDYVGIINNDAVAHKSWLKESMDAIMQNKKTAASTSKILFYDNPKKINSAGTKITPIGAGFDRGFMESSKKYNENQYNCSATGCAMIIKRSIFKEVGGFDSSYFAYFEDTDLSWKIWLYGYNIVYVSNAIVLHKFGAGFGGLESPNRIYLGGKNRLMSAIKNYEFPNLLKALAISAFYDSFRILKYLKKGRIGNAYLTFKAVGFVIKNMPSVLRKRSEVQHRRKLSDRELFDKGIIISFKQSMKEYFRVLVNT